MQENPHHIPESQPIQTQRERLASTLRGPTCQCGWGWRSAPLQSFPCGGAGQQGGGPQASRPSTGPSRLQKAAKACELAASVPHCPVCQACPPPTVRQRRALKEVLPTHQSGREPLPVRPSGQEWLALALTPRALLGLQESLILMRKWARCPVGGQSDQQFSLSSPEYSCFQASGTSLGAISGSRSPNLLISHLSPWDLAVVLKFF